MPKTTAAWRDLQYRCLIYNSTMCRTTVLDYCIFWGNGRNVDWYAWLYYVLSLCATFKNMTLLYCYFAHLALCKSFCSDFQHVSYNNIWRLCFTWHEKSEKPCEIRSGQTFWILDKTHVTVYNSGCQPWGSQASNGALKWFTICQNNHLISQQSLKKKAKHFILMSQDLKCPLPW